MVFVSPGSATSGTLEVLSSQASRLTFYEDEPLVKCQKVDKWDPCSVSKTAEQTWSDSDGSPQSPAPATGAGENRTISRKYIAGVVSYRYTHYSCYSSKSLSYHNCRSSEAVSW